MILIYKNLLLDPPKYKYDMCRDILLKTGNAFAKKSEFKINKGFWIKNQQ